MDDCNNVKFKIVTDNCNLLCKVNYNFFRYFSHNLVITSIGKYFNKLNSLYLYLTKYINVYL